jgi:type III restriction enzyme
MSNPFFDHPVLNSPYGYPRIIDNRRSAKFITPIPKPKKHKAAAQTVLVFDEGKGLSTKEQQYDPTSIINEVRGYVDTWRQLSPGQWQVSPETRRLLEHWRQHQFSGVRVEVTRTWCSCKRRAACCAANR